MCSPWSINYLGWCLGSDTKLKSHLSAAAPGTAVSTPAQVFAPGLFNILGQGTEEIKEGPQDSMGCNYLCWSFLQVVDLAVGG